MLSPRIRHTVSVPMNSRPMRNAWARPFGPRLLGVGERYAPGACRRPAAAGRAAGRGGGDDQDLADARQHQHGERVVDHRLVVDRQQLLADDQRDRIQPRAGAAGQDDALHRSGSPFPFARVPRTAARAGCPRAAARGGIGRVVIRSGFITPSDARWSAAGGLQASRNAHPPQADCAFESACALPSGVIRGCETTSKNRDRPAGR